MPLSKFFARATARTLETLFNASDADIRVYGEEHIPDGPLLYVVNHFTRMETLFLPYIILKYTKQFPYSLAHKSFFGGTFGKVMSMLGAVSTGNAERDKILTGSLLTGSNPVIIFPEGQMLKDKKLIEKGKFMVYNTGIRRPPHTGAARMALRAEFYRQKLKYLMDMGYTDRIEIIKKFFDISDNDLQSITKMQTRVVPVNITYYPIRARDNSIKNLAERFFKTIPERFEEELEVEGTMLMEGVDIDINFGRPIDVGDYLYSSKKAAKQIENSHLYLSKQDARRELGMRKQSLKLMKTYMRSIYSLTTINYDHVFSYILYMSPRDRFPESALKNKAFLTIEKLKTINWKNIHSTLRKNQFHLLTDDEHDRYNSFIEAAVSDKLITIEDGYIIKNKKRFSSQYQFHNIRKDNVIEVCKNEIEPLTDIMKIMHRMMFNPPWLDRMNIRKRFIKLDRDMFMQDYRKYSIKGESKPTEIGSPFFMKRFFAKKGIILVHGYMAAPEEIRIIAENLYKAGYTVYGARLRGHGTAPEDLAKREWYNWYNSVNRAYIIMDNTVSDLAICGFSTGAGLALLQTANKKNKFKGVISISAPLKLQNITSNLSSAVVAWNKFLGKLKVSRGTMEYIENQPENPHINYFRNPISGVSQLGKLMHEVEKKLPLIDNPSMIIQGSHDPVVNPISGLEIFEKLTSKERTLCRIYSNRHGIVRGEESDKVTDQILLFLRKTVFSNNKKEKE